MTNYWAEKDEVFLGTLHVLDSTTPTDHIPGGPRQAVYLSRFTDADGERIAGQSDWLITGKQQPPCVFRFLFQSSTEERLHFMITGSGEDHDKKLGISRNGYLGLYKHASVTDYIKLQPLFWTENALLCRIRDHQGHAVRTHHEPSEHTPNFEYLRINEGQEVMFLLERTTG
ncbi:hypothetical protein [Pseudomonas sp. NPDC008258]|uniref:hypothetical protein n=1 Tax=Pseudomonas sp. NPDC008258 TaxID=3364418 RepID=UPI0036E11B91